MQDANEMNKFFEFVGLCVAVGAAGFKYYQYITADDEVAIRQEREIISTQREQMAELREMTTELSEIAIANATLLQDSDAQLRELEVLLFPEDGQQAKKGTNTCDLLLTLNQGRPNAQKKLPQEGKVDSGFNNEMSKTENLAITDLVIMEDYPSEEFIQNTLVFKQ